MNGTMPYFRLYASQWLARLSSLPREAQLLVLKAVFIAWDETRTGMATRTVTDWARETGTSEIDVLVGARALEGRPWCRIASSERHITVHVPEMDEQAEIVTYERDKTRRRRERERGLTPGHIEGGSEPGGSERPAGDGPAVGRPSVPSGKDEDHRAWMASFDARTKKPGPPGKA